MPVGKADERRVIRARTQQPRDGVDADRAFDRRRNEEDAVGRGKRCLHREQDV